MTISTAGTGPRNLLVSYVSEAPVWKTTYRIVLAPDTQRFIGEFGRDKYGQALFTPCARNSCGLQDTGD